MIDALISGKLIKDCQLKTSANGNQYANFLMGVSVGEADNIILSGIAFGESAEKIAKLTKGDAIAVSGSLKPSEWQDKATGITKHGLSVTVSNLLSVYDIQKRRMKSEADKTTQPNKSAYDKLYGTDKGKPLDDELTF